MLWGILLSLKAMTLKRIVLSIMANGYTEEMILHFILARPPTEKAHPKIDANL